MVADFECCCNDKVALLVAVLEQCWPNGNATVAGNVRKILLTKCDS